MVIRSVMLKRTRISKANQKSKKEGEYGLKKRVAYKWFWGQSRGVTRKGWKWEIEEGKKDVKLEQMKWKEIESNNIRIKKRERTRRWDGESFTTFVVVLARGRKRRGVGKWGRGRKEERKKRVRTKDKRNRKRSWRTVRSWWIRKRRSIR